MRNFFRYDYNYKLIVIGNLISLVLLVITVASYNNALALCLFGIAFLLNTLNSFIVINRYGIHLCKNKVIIVDGLFYRSINLSEIRRVEIKEIEKEKKSNKYGLFHEFYHYSTYLDHCDYTYNNGKVYNIVFHLKNNTKKESYFGWMYKEKNEEKVKKKQAELTAFVDHINKVCKER